MTQPQQRRKMRLGVSLVLGLLALALCLTPACMRTRRIREIDKQIVADVEAALISKLQSLSEDNNITLRYGKFVRLTDVQWNRPNYFWMLVVRLDFSAIAHFEKAQARVYLGIDKGGPAPPAPPDAETEPEPIDTESVSISRLEMRPSEEWRRRNPALAGELKLIDGELWMCQDIDSGRTRCVIEGWATHPDFVYD